MKKSKPYIIISESLSLQQEHYIAKLVSVSNSYDNTDMSFPIEEDTIYFLIYNDDKKLIQASCLYFLTELSYEVSSFTLPIMRNHGLFTYIFNEMRNYLKKLYPDNYHDIILSFTATSSSIADEHILPKLGATKESEELNMELLLDYYFLEELKNKPDFNTKIQAYDTPINKFDIKIMKVNSDDKYTISNNENFIGEFYLLEHDSGVYFYHFYLHELYKGKGYGYYIFFHIINFLLKNNYKKISLHVKKDNIPAVKIYTFFNFKVVESLVSWVLKINN